MKLSSASRAAALLVAVLVLDGVDGFSVNIVGRKRSEVLGARAFPRGNLGRLGRRSIDMNGSYGNGSTSVSDMADTMYSCNITLGGAEFETLIDTGSSDLWVAGSVPQVKDLNIPATVSYAKGNAQGSISTATLVFDTYTIPDQAFINVVSSADNPPTQGLIGLGPGTSSVVRKLVGNSTGNPPLDRIFRQNLTTPNFLSVLLQRVSDDTLGTPQQLGQLTIGAVIPGMENVTSQPKLPALVDEYGIQHWQTMLDANGVIGPDGQSISTRTTIPKADNPNSLRVVFDTGFTLPQVTQDIADAIYGRVPGAVFVPQTDTPGYWRIPCDYELNVAFKFGGVTVPIAPLDLTLVDETDKEGNPLNCMATFQQISPTVADHTHFGAFDMILGMAFLRNVYLLINFGDFVDGSPANTADPYIQLLPVTDVTAAHADFVKVRLGGKDTSASQAPLVPIEQAQHSPQTASSSPNNAKNTHNSAVNDVKNFFAKSIWFIVLAAVAGVVLLAMIAWCLLCFCRRRRSKVRGEGAFVPAMGSYKPLRDPTPPQRSESPVWDYSYTGQHGAPEPPTYGAGYLSSARYSEPNYYSHGRS